MGSPRRLGAPAILTLLAITACTPVAAGPELPRPAQIVAAPDTTTPPPTTTTTVDPADVMAAQCPDVVCLVYRIDPGARWSDGQPVVAADFAATVTAFQGESVAADDGYDLISGVDIIDEKTVRVAMRQRFGAWESLFTRLIPAHAATLDATNIPSTAPFTFDRWVPGDRIVVQRNDEWWSAVEPISGNDLGPVDEIEFVFIPDPDDMVAAIAAGEVDVIVARPDQNMVEDLIADGVNYTLAPGPFWEHIDFHHEDEMLAQPWVREMFDLAIDRQAILEQTIRLLDPDAVGLDNTIWMANTADYEVHYQDRFDPDAAEQLLIDNGCVIERGVYVCGEREMSFIWASTNDDPWREGIFEAVRDDMAAVGIELIPDLKAPSAFINREFLFGGPEVWHLINFSWRAGSDPARAEQTYLCGSSDFNVNRFCSVGVEETVRAAATEMEPGLRAAEYNEADRQYLSELAAIPLYQKPMLMAWSSGWSGLAPNYSTSTDLWNVVAWTGESSLVVALPGEPTSLDALSIADDNANIVLSTLLYGAFGMDPSLRHLPVLVDSVEVVFG